MTTAARPVTIPAFRRQCRSAGKVGHRLVLLAVLMLGGLSGCGSIESVAPADPPITDPTKLYMSLTIDHPAVTLSTDTTDLAYYTLQLTAIPRDALGNPMSGLPAPTFTSSDTSALKVSADGRLTAVHVGTGIMVTATLTAGPVTHTDQAIVNVYDKAAPSPLGSFSIQPVPPDLPIRPLIAEGTLQGTEINYGAFAAVISGYYPPTILEGVHPVTPIALNAAGEMMPEIVVSYASLDYRIATINRWTGEATLLRPGQVRFVAQATAYGVSKTDTLLFTVTMPVVVDIPISDIWTGSPTFGKPPHIVRLLPNGILTWANYSNDSVDVVFDDPTNVLAVPTAVCDFAKFFSPSDPCGAGDMSLPPVLAANPDPFSEIPFQLRQFPERGVYNYHSVRLGTSGQVIVTDSLGS